MARGGGKSLHVALFPWLAFGHMIPFLEVAKHLAHRGHRVSFISTPRNLRRLPQPPPHLAPLITFVPLPLPSLSAVAAAGGGGSDHHFFPEDAESSMDLPLHLLPVLMSAYDGLRDPLAAFLRDSSPPVDWMIQDFVPHWLPPVAAELGISRAFFSIFPTWFMVFLGPTASVAAGNVLRQKPEDFSVPPEWVPFPSSLAFRPYCARLSFQLDRKNDAGVSYSFRYASTVVGCDAYAMRSCSELDGEWFSLLPKINVDKPVFPLGLMPPTDNKGEGAAADDDDTWRRIGGWLDGQQEEGSVVYVALGSEANPSEEQLTELALGLELSGLPFLWILRKPQELDSPLVLPVGFEERVRGRGMVWTRWAPQPRLLSHDSVGGFLTHCGLSSVIEALQRGKPLIMLSFLWDQGLNARILEEKGVGLEIPRDHEDGSLSRHSVAESLRRVMVSEEGRVYREKAREMGKMVADGALHDRYMDGFVEYLQRQRETKATANSNKTDLD